MGEPIAPLLLWMGWCPAASTLAFRPCHLHTCASNSTASTPRVRSPGHTLALHRPAHESSRSIRTVPALLLSSPVLRPRLPLPLPSHADPCRGALPSRRPWLRRPGRASFLARRLSLVQGRQVGYAAIWSPSLPRLVGRTLPACACRRPPPSIPPSPSFWPPSCAPLALPRWGRPRHSPRTTLRSCSLSTPACRTCRGTSNTRRAPPS